MNKGKSIALAVIDFLKSNAEENEKKQWLRTIKVHEDVYGVKLARINPMISEWTRDGASFEDVSSLWEDGKVESRIIAAKLLGRIGRRDVEKTMNLLNTFSKTLRDWPTTDTLATQGVGAILKEKKEDIKKLALRSLKSKNTWTKRFGLVLFINFPKDGAAKEILLNYLKSENYYVRKAAEWLKRKIERS